MQIKTSPKHNRTLDVLDIPTSHVTDPRNLEIAVNYTNTGEEGNIHKAIALDGKVLPFILKATEVYNALLALKQAGQLEIVQSLATDGSLDDDEGGELEDEYNDQQAALEGFAKLLESL